MAIISKDFYACTSLGGGGRDVIIHTHNKILIFCVFIYLINIMHDKEPFFILSFKNRYGWKMICMLLIPYDLLRWM